MFQEAWAQAGAPAGGGLMQVVPLVVIFVLFYFLMIRPQVKRQKQHAEMLKAIKIGDQVVTSSGIIGSIKSLNDKVITVEIADGVRVKMLRGQISQVVTGPIDQIKETT